MKATSPLPLALLLLLGACQSSQAVKSAGRGEHAQAREALSSERVSEQRAKVLAAAALGHDIEEASGHDGRAFIASLFPCTLELRRPLLRRSRKKDPVAAEAALLLIEHGAYRGPRLKNYRDDPDGAWRALAARVTQDDQEARVAFFLDDDERVRRAALSAAVEAKDPADTPALLEASRVDPDALIRSRAVLALARIGGPTVLLALKDRFESAGEEARLAIVDAYASPALLSVGGLAQLRRIVEEDNGFVALHAASLLAKQSGEERALGIARLVRFATEGTTEEKRLALRVMPSDSKETESTLLAATRAEDEQVAIIAWARLLGRDTRTTAAEEALLKLAQEKKKDLAYQAKAALAAAAAPQAEELFLADVKAPSPEIRIIAGYGLLRLQRFETLAPLLADDERSVRQAVGCRLLSTSP
jgi:hypothetical protein